jgi:CBS domain-containing protein
MHRLNDILHQDKLFSVRKEDSVSAVAREMASLGVGAILVLDNGRLCGLFSERDLMVRVVVTGRNPDTTLVAEVMTTELTTVADTASVDEAMELMHARKCRHLPVMRGDRVAGMVSMRDLMDDALASRTEELHHMRAYITQA